MFFFLYNHSSYEGDTLILNYIHFIHAIVNIIYHKLILSRSIEFLFSVIDNYLITIRMCAICYYFHGINLNFVKINIFISTFAAIFDYENYAERNYAGITFFLSLFYLKKKDYSLWCKYGFALLFYCIEYYPIEIMGHDFGLFLRNNKYFSNHEVFHILLYFADLGQLKKFNLRGKSL